jgi:hypothetical protein
LANAWQDGGFRSISNDRCGRGSGHTRYGGGTAERRTKLPFPKPCRVKNKRPEAGSKQPFAAVATMAACSVDMYGLLGHFL